MGSLERRVNDPDAWYAPLVTLAFGLLIRLRTSNGMLAGSGAAFWVVLAVVPSILALASLAGLFISPETILDSIESMVGTVSPQLEELIEDATVVFTSSTAGLSAGFFVSIVAALWSTSTAVMYLMRAVTQAYAIRETRSYLRQRWKSLVTATVGVVLLAAIIVVPVVLPPQLDELADALEAVFTLAQGALQLVVYTWLFVLFYAHATPVFVGDWLARFPGAAAAACGWVVGGFAINVYADNYGNYANVYGALAGAVLGMLVLWFLVLCLIGGAIINAQLWEQFGSSKDWRRHAQHPPPQHPPEEPGDGAPYPDEPPAMRSPDATDSETAAPPDDTATGETRRTPPA